MTGRTRQESASKFFRFNDTVTGVKAQKKETKVDQVQLMKNFIS
jgi:hypothetical protein